MSQYDVTASHHLIITVIYGDPQGLVERRLRIMITFWAFARTFTAHPLVYSRLLFTEATALPVVLSGRYLVLRLVELLGTTSSFSTSHSSRCLSASPSYSSRALGQIPACSTRSLTHMLSVIDFPRNTDFLFTTYLPSARGAVKVECRDRYCSNRA